MNLLNEDNGVVHCLEEKETASSLAYFQYVIEHQVRLLPHSPNYFVDGLSIGISRYICFIVDSMEIICKRKLAS